MNTTEAFGVPYVVADATPNEREAFLKNTYLHLAGALLAFIGLESLILNSPLAAPIATTLGQNWWIVLLAFMGVSWVADRWASSGSSQSMQYLGLGVFIVAEAIIFVPLLFLAQMAAGDSQIILKAGVLTGGIVVGITALAFITKADFSFLKGFLVIGGFVALGLIFASMIFGFNLGIVFAGAMAIFAGASVLYTTSNLIHHYHPSQHVAAALALFSGIALLFWYILRIFMSRR